jgi:hypothetical protein
LRYRQFFALPTIATGALLAAAAANANDALPIATPIVVRDFLTQNVCLDGDGSVLMGISPADRDPACIEQRDLRPGERLPYHKHDHRSPDQRADAPRGYQRHDSFPVETLGLGTVIEQSFDFGAGEGRRFGVFDAGSDGGDIVILTPGVASIGATEDASGFQLFVGKCRGRVDATALALSWIVAEFDPGGSTPLRGETIAHLKELRTGHQETCPASFNAAVTTWRVAPFHYRAAPDQGRPVTLPTLISEHYGGADRAKADHVERFYFTRELGGTRWERWQNARGNAQYSAATVAARAAGFAATGRCSAAEPPSGAPTVLIDCREWTSIVPPNALAGDLPGFFVAAIRARPSAPALFAAPPKKP